MTSTCSQRGCPNLGLRIVFIAVGGTECGCWSICPDDLCDLVDTLLPAVKRNLTVIGFGRSHGEPETQQATSNCWSGGVRVIDPFATTTLDARNPHANFGPTRRTSHRTDGTTLRNNITLTLKP